MVHIQPPTRSPQKTRQGETKNEDKEETEIVVRNKQETASRPPQSQKKSVVPSTVSRKVSLILECLVYYSQLRKAWENASAESRVVWHLIAW